MEFIFELLYAVVRLVCRVCSKNYVNEVGYLLVTLVEIRSNAGLFVLLKIPVIDDHNKEHCFGSAYEREEECR